MWHMHAAAARTTLPRPTLFAVLHARDVSGIELFLNLFSSFFFFLSCLMAYLLGCCLMANDASPGIPLLGLSLGGACEIWGGGGGRASGCRADRPDQTEPDLPWRPYQIIPGKLTECLSVQAEPWVPILEDLFPSCSLALLGRTARSLDKAVGLLVLACVVC